MEQKRLASNEKRTAIRDRTTGREGTSVYKRQNVKKQKKEGVNEKERTGIPGFVKG